MRINKILITLKKELNSIIRDKKSLAMMFLMPLMIPVFIFLMSFIYDDMDNSLKESVYSVGVNYTMNANEKEIASQLSLNVISYDSVEKMNEAYEKSEISAYVNLENNIYTIFMNPDDQDSAMSGSYLNEYLSAYNDFLAQNYLLGQDIEPTDVFNIVKVEFKELEGKSYIVDLLISIGLAYSLMAIITTATYCATDIIAGEKERGTLETLLTFPIKSSELITGKYLATFISCIITSLVSLIFCFGSLKLASGMFEIYNSSSLNISLTTILLSVLIFIFASFIASGVCIAIACFCKSYKESQEALTPVSFISLFPMILPMAGIETNIVLSLIPIINHGMLLNDIVSNNIDVSNILVMIASSIVCTIIVIIFISKQYKSEKVLFS